METKSINITPPEGYVVDEKNSTFEKIVFKPIDTKPRSWEEYCKQTSANTHWGFYKGQVVSIFCGTSCELLNKKDKASVPSRELAEAFLAMMQLMSLRQAWIGEWKPDWFDRDPKFTIQYENGEKLEINKWYNMSRPLSFPTEEMAEDFLNCFRDLIKQAKPLI